MDRIIFDMRSAQILESWLIVVHQEILMAFIQIKIYQKIYFLNLINLPKKIRFVIYLFYVFIVEFKSFEVLVLHLKTLTK